MAGETDKRTQEQPQEPTPARPSGKAGDTIAVNVGEGAAHVAAGKNIIQIGSLTVPRWAMLLLVAALALIAVLVGAVAWFTQKTGENTQRTAAILAYTPTATATITPVPAPTPTPLPFAPAAEGETMIVLLPFHSTTANNSEVHVKIWRRIRDLLAQMPEGGVTAVIDPNAMFTADQRAEAEQIGKRHNASMVIWGEDTGVEVIANFLNLRQPDMPAADVDIQETQRTQLANPSQYAEFVTRDLPGQLAFLSLFAVGQSHYLNNDYEAAIDTIDSAIAEVRLPENQNAGDAATEVTQGLADAYFRLGWLYQQAPVDLDAAIASYSQTIQFSPEDTAAYGNRGIAYTGKGELDQAIADFTKAIELDPQDAISYYNRGFSYFSQGDFGQALGDFSKAIEFDPQYAFAYNNRGLTYYQLDDFDQAIADHTKAIGLDPQNVEAYYNRGNAYYVKGELDQAVADFSRALELDPKRTEAYYNRGAVYHEQGDRERAIADFTEAVALDPQLAVAFYSRGNAYAEQGSFDQAIADYTEASRLDPQDADAHNLLCWYLALQQQPQQAMTHCEKAVALAENPSYTDNRGLAHALLGDYPAAMADFQIVVDWLADNQPQETQTIEQRRTWIAALGRGENPFTPDVLEELKQE